MLDADIGTECRQAPDVLVDGALSDRTAAGQAHAGLPKTCEQGAEHEYRRTHGLDQLVGRFKCSQLISSDADGVAGIAIAAHAHLTQQLERG